MECLRCGKSFRRFCDLKRHFKNKQICKHIYLDIDQNTMINCYKQYLPIFYNIKDQNRIINNHTEDHKEIINNHKYTQIICEHCGRYFHHKTNYYRHKKDYCKVIIATQLTEQITQSLTQSVFNIKYDALQIEYENKFQELEDKINNLLSHTTQNNIESNNITYNQVNQITDIITNNTININKYGNENLSNLNLEQWEKILSTEFNMITNLIKHIHIDTEENRNIYIPSTKEKYASIFQDDKWNLVEKDNLIKYLVQHNCVRIQDAIDTYGTEFTKISAKRTQNILNLCESDSDEIEKTKVNTSLMFINENEIVRNTYQKNYNKKMKAR